MKKFKEIKKNKKQYDYGTPEATAHAKKMTPGQQNEGTWAIPKNPKDKAALKKLMSKPIKLGKEGDEAAGKIYSLIGDDELFDDLYLAGKKNPNGDARPVIKKHMKRLKISEAKDPNEYDNEGEMAKTQLRGIISDAQHMIKMFDDNENLPEWVQNKITKATDYINSAHRYMMNNGESDNVDEEKDPRLARAGVSGFNKAKRTPGHPKKSHIVVAKDGNKVKTIRFGQQGAETAGDPKKGESDRMKAKRKSFKARHGKNIAKGKMSAAYWADKEKW